MPKFIDGTFLLLVAILAVLVAVAWVREGSQFALDGLGGGAQLLLRFAAVLVVSFLIAGLAEKLIPHEWVRGALGVDAGMRGLLLATAAGMVTPAGPFVSMPIAVALHRSGAAMPNVVAFLVSWSVLSIHRIIAWEVPILGPRIALVRWGVCILFPILAGLLTRVLVKES